MPPNLSDAQIAELARQQADLDMTDEQVMQMAQQQATHDVLAQGPPQEKDFNEQYIRPAILPTGLGIAGGIAGAPLGPIGSIVGSGIGSGIGEGINQLAGFTEPDLGNLGMATAAPMVVGGALQAVKPLAQFAGAKGAQVLNALAPDEASGQLAKMAPLSQAAIAEHLASLGPMEAAKEVGKLAAAKKLPAAFLFKQATQSQVKVPMNRTIHAIDGLLDDLTNVSKGVQGANSQVIGYLKGLKAKLISSPYGPSNASLTPLELQRELEGAGQIVASVKAKGGTGSGAVKQIFKHLVNDLDDATKLANPAQPGARALVAARDMFKKESVLKEIGEAIDSATKVMRGQGGDVQFNPAAVLNAVKKNEFYTTALSVKERGEIEGLLKMLNKIPVLRPGAGQQFGSGRMAQMAASATAGGGVGFYGGGPSGAAIGAVVGAAVPPIAEFGRNLTTAMQMASGRALMKELLVQSKGSVTPQVASILAAYAEAVRAGSVNE